MELFSKFFNFTGKGEITSFYPKQKLDISGLNGIPFTKASEPSDWAKVKGQVNLNEPEVKNPHGLRLGSGCVIKEKDGRYWVVHPTNQFGGYEATFPKGGVEEGLSLQANAIKETFEESGLMVRITGVLVDVTRTTSVARYYTAVRVGGSPVYMGWESEKVSLVPKSQLSKILTHPADKPILAAL